MTRAAVVMTSVLLLIVSMSPVLFSFDYNDVNVRGEEYPPGTITINSLDELLLIGDHEDYPLSGNYIQTTNIDFKDGDYNGGFNIDTKVTIQKNSIDDTKYDITISLHYSDTELSPTTTPTQPALISLNGTIQEISSGDMKATFTFPSDELPDTLEISAGGITYNIPNDAWTDADKKTDNNFAIACSFTGITGTTEGPLEYTSNSNGNFTPIGSESVPFTGTYDGDGFTINNLNTAARSSPTVYSGMFGYIKSDNVELKGIGLTNNSSIAINPSSSGLSSLYAFSSGLVGYIDATNGTATIQDCYTTGNITATAISSYTKIDLHTYSSGLVGYININGGTATIQDCYTTGNITTTASSALTSPIPHARSGGLIGYIHTNGGTVTIQDCYTTGNITATSSSSAPSMPNAHAYSGGLAGHISVHNGTATIQDCYTTGNITATSSSSSSYAYTYSGGLVGRIDMSSGCTTAIQNCYAVGEITADVGGASGNCANGGIAGYLSYGTSYIYNCYYLSEDEINNGLNTYGEKDDSATVYIDGVVSTDGTSGRAVKPSGGRTLEELQNKETYYDGKTIIPGSTPEEEVNGWSFYDPDNTEKESIWFIDEKIDENDTREPNERVNNGLPVLMAIEYKIFIHPKDVISNNVADNTFFVRSSIEGTYQWYYSTDDASIPNEEKEWKEIPDATSNEYKTSDDNDIDNFYNFYRCIVTITPKQKIVSDSAQLLMDCNMVVNITGDGTVSFNDQEIDASPYEIPFDQITKSMEFIITPNEYNRIELISLNGTDIVVSGNNYIITPVAGKNTLNITFVETEYNISIFNDIVNGKISLEDDITKITNSKTCEITITPDANYVLGDIWIVQDEDDEDGDPKTAILTEIDGTTYKLSNVTGNCTIKASFVLVDYTIKVTDQIANGSLYSSKSQMTYEGVATITITPDANYVLDDIWIVQDQDKGENDPKFGSLSPVENNSCTLSNVTGNCTINATFILANYMIKISDQITNGSLSSSKIQMTYEDVATITITPGANYILDKIWIVEDVDKEESAPKTATLVKVNDTKYELSNVTGDCTINAIFVLANYTIDISDQIANGSILSSKDTMTYNDTATITITPDANYVLDKIWIVQDQDKGENDPKFGSLSQVENNSCTLSNVTGDCTINATFVLANYTIKISDQITNGSLSSSKDTMTYEDTATIRITPNDGYELESISCGGNGILMEVSGTEYKLSNVKDDCTITATFVLKEYTISITQSDNGFVSSSVDTMTYEDTATITIEPTEGYELDTIDHGNNGTLTKINDTTYELSNVTDDCTITATFKVITIPDEEPIDEGDGNGYDVKTIFAMMYISLVLIMLIAVVLGLTKP